MSSNLLRDYYNEKLLHLQRDLQLFQLTGKDPRATLELHNDSDLDRTERTFKLSSAFFSATDLYESEINKYKSEILKSSLHERTQKGYLYIKESKSDNTNVRNHRARYNCPPGIIRVPYQFATGNVIRPTDDVPETGFPIHPRIKAIITNSYPTYQTAINEFVRPLGTTEATVTDFLKEQRPSDPPIYSRKQRILKHIHHFLASKPYRPLHYVDSLYSGLPLHTGTGYHNRHSFRAKCHAKFSHPARYNGKPTSKGYFYNFTRLRNRTYIHQIKLRGHPLSQNGPDTKTRIKHFLLKRPTILFTRSHISKRKDNLKQRPVYCADELFLDLESMLTFPLHVTARSPSCCIMYGFETLRGSNAEINRIAQHFRSYLMLDWSSFDQRLPRVITDIFWTDFLEELIVINKGYAPTYDYPTYPDLTTENMFNRVTNMLHFLHTWYNNMVFVTADGHGFIRTAAGVPSGILNTQYLDSFGNLFLLIDGLIEYGKTDQEIEQLKLFIMGDDNCIFTQWSLEQLESFFKFFITYANQRYGMIMSETKSTITSDRTSIETLSYQNNHGFPRKDITKLIAQLCYPERGVNVKFMSARAIGIAYAACGIDPEFHKFCESIYNEFKSDSIELDNLETLLTAQSKLPGYLKVDETLLQTIDFSQFPHIDMIRNLVLKWHGPLPMSPKWNESHFINSPNEHEKDYITALGYRKHYRVQRKPIPNLWK
nr:MAG: RNA-dependent RNA polymerase [Tuatara cloaca-associated partitivirus-1]